MGKVRFLLKKSWTPVTILVIPHDSLKSLSVKVPAAALLLCLVLSAVGGIHLYTRASKGLEYDSLVKKVDFYSQQFSQWQSTVLSLNEVEKDFRRAFSLKSKEKILESIDTSYSGSADIQALMDELRRTVDTVDEIKDYLRREKDLHLATPKGFPVEGNISSPFGRREDPLKGHSSFHSGVDISASPGTPIRATADGIVSHSGWTQNSGYLVVVEHGLGFSTVYAHNRKNAVKVGQNVKRGDIVGYVGSTGKSTGPHVHYEVWEKGKSVNPKRFLQGRS